MKYIEQIIKKAIEGGYPAQGYFSDIIQIKATDNVREGLKNAMFLDPDFWKSLGKAMGWEIPVKANYEEGGRKENQFSVMQPSWKEQWHNFIDHLAEGKSAEDYFKELLK